MNITQEIKQDVLKHSFRYYRIVEYKGEPAIGLNMNDYHSRIKCKGVSFIVDNDTLQPLIKSYLMVCFYQNLPVRVKKEKKFYLVIEIQGEVKQVNKKDVNFVFCAINKHFLRKYIKDFGVCFALSKEIN